MRYRRRRLNGRAPLIGIVLLAASILLLIIVMGPFFSSPEKQAKRLADQFYSYEQEGDFSSSWELFHSGMKEKFHKGDYIQDRAHVFMNHFGVETFTYELSDLEEIHAWKMTSDSPILDEVYKLTVTQTYKGKYGNFELVQPIFVAEEDDEWRLLWDFNQ